MKAHERRALPEGWEIVDLPEIVFFQEGPGVRKHQFTTEGIKLINVGNLANNELVLENTETHISIEEATKKYKHFLVDEGDLIIASSGIKVDYFHKKIAFAKREHLPLCMNTSTIRFKPLNKNKISMKFFRYFIMTPFFTKQVQFHITGSAQLNFGPSHLEKMKLILPPLDIQNKIVSILEKAEETKKLRAQADELTDRLLQSLFLEMFGDPVKNPKGWDIVTLNNVCDKITDGTHQRPTYIEKGVPFLSVKNITKGYLDLSDIKYISLEEHEKLIRRCKPEEGDILYTKVGVNYGIAELVSINTEFSIYVSLALLKPNHKIINSKFFKYVLNSNYVKRQAIDRISGIGVPDLHLIEIKQIKIPIPPLPLQQKFSRIVEKIEAMRQSQNQSKQQIENLFSTLMQKAFRGELER